MTKKNTGFTIIELMVTIAIAAILFTLGAPSLTEYLTEQKVNNEISQVHRLLLTARNSAINSSQQVIFCPLNDSGKCTSNWNNELSVFNDNNGDGDFDTDTDLILKIKQAVESGDTLSFSASSVTFSPSGQLNDTQLRTFNFCPKDNSDKNRGVIVSMTGRIYQTTDSDNDGKDENRNGVEISCE